MILKSDRIAELLQQGQGPDAEDPLILTPSPHLDALRTSGAASIDLHLGTWFTVLRQARIPHLPLDAEVPEAKLTKTHYVPFGESYFLHPGAFVLAMTLEWIRLPKNLAGYLIGRSTWGRRGLIVATATGVHPGFFGCLTLELTNVGEIPTPIEPGTAVCQLFLHSIETLGLGYVDQSAFNAMRKPRLGPLTRDEIAKNLAEAYLMRPKL